MGLPKEYRKGLKYRVASAKCKTIEALLAVKFRDELGMSQTESRLLGDSIGKWILLKPDLRGPNQIIFEASKGKNSFTRRYSTLKKIKLTPYASEDLDLQLEFGLSVAQIGRIMRLIEEAYSQDATLSAKQLTLLLNITPTALRKKLKNLREQGLFVPVKGMSLKDRKKKTLFRSTFIMAKYLQGVSLVDIRKNLGISVERFRNIYSSFIAVTKIAADRRFVSNDTEELQWASLAKSTSKEKIEKLKIEITPVRGRCSWDAFSASLIKDFNLSPIKLLAIKESVEEILSTMSGDRADGDIIYWAISAGEPAGKPLEVSKLVPSTLTYYDPGDMPSPEVNRDLNRVADIKFRKVVRLAAQAKACGGYLTYADLGYLLGIHSEAISRLVKANSKVVVPLRGSSCDIGQGITHRRKIIKLYLEMHTETEIVSRTGHSYESIENYINEFAKVFVLYERGMPLPLIRRVTGRSIRLISAYMELIKEYSGPEYAFRFAHLRKIFKTHNLKKNNGKI
ncbi:MAG: DUF1670 domain-containing protein [Actinobacteria bacterium]|nr:DUF1670 domain-containing protein [Actinomycetota bacterium]